MAFPFPVWRRTGGILATGLATSTALIGAIPTKHGALFDGCPLCTNGRIGADGAPLDPISGSADFSSAGLAKPDGLPPRPTRPTAAGKSPAVTPLTKTEPLPELKKRADGFWEVSFAHLASFAFEAPAAPPEKPATAGGASEKIPELVRSLDGRRVRIAGFMLPTKLEGGLAKEFLLLRTSMLCCYGITPAPTEWIVVTMKGKGAVPVKDVPLHFYGTLRVGEIYQDTSFVGIYAMDGEKVSVE